MAKLTEQLTEQLKTRHYIRKANDPSFWFGFYPNKINSFKKIYKENFYFVLYQNIKGFNYYAIPYTVLKSLLREDTKDIYRERWFGHIRNNELIIKNQALSVKDFYNLDIEDHTMSSTHLELTSYDTTPMESESNLLTEGSKIAVLVNRFERNPEAKKKCIEYYGTACQICGFDFKDKYGEIGEGFIETHHKKPISEIGQSYELDPINDLIPVCSNCHSMLHRTITRTLEINELKEMLETKKLTYLRN